jgi:ankyrin repeat protein
MPTHTVIAALLEGDRSEEVALSRVAATDAEGSDALWIASAYGFADVVSLLLRYGGDPLRIHPSIGKSPLQRAQEQGRAAIVRIMSNVGLAAESEGGA